MSLGTTSLWRGGRLLESRSARGIVVRQLGTTVVRQPDDRHGPDKTVGLGSEVPYEASGAPCSQLNCQVIPNLSVQAPK